MNIQEFGASIKAKYPEYKEYDDALIGQKMLEKYPEYKDRVDVSSAQSPTTQTPQVQPQQNMLQGILQTGKNVANAVAPISNFLMPTVVSEGQKLFQDIGAGTWKPPAPPTLPEVGASALGFLGERFLGSDRQKTKAKMAEEVGSTVLTATGVPGLLKGGVSLALKGPKMIQNILKTGNITPSRIATAARNESAIQNTIKIGANDVKQAFINAGNNSTGGIRQKAIEYAAQDAERIGNSDFTVKKLVEELTKQWNASHTAKGVEMTKAQSQYALQARDELMKLLGDKAPEIAKQTQNIGKLIKGQNNVVKFLKWILPPVVISGGIRSMASQ